MAERICLPFKFDLISILFYILFFTDHLDEIFLILSFKNETEKKPDIIENL